MKKAVIYLRVSTDDKEQDPNRQMAKCKEVLNNNNYQLVKTLTDKFTGSVSIYDRPSGKWLKKNEHKWDILIFYDLSRFSRQDISKVLGELDGIVNKGKKYISATEEYFNAESPFSPLLISLISFINNYQRKQIVANVKSGLANAIRKGKKLGPPTVMSEEVRGSIKNLLNDGNSLYKISRMKEMPSYNTMKRDGFK